MSRVGSSFAGDLAFPDDKGTWREFRGYHTVVHDKHPMYLALRESSYLRLSVPDPGGKSN